MKILLIHIISLLFVASVTGQSYKWAINAGDVEMYGVEADSQGNSYITGEMNSGTTIGNTTFDSWGGYIAKLNLVGEVIWVKSFGDWDTSGSDVAVDSKGNVWITGYTYFGFTFGGIEFTSRNPFIMKFSSTGTFEWGESLVTVNGVDLLLGGGSAVCVDSQDNVYIGGNYSAEDGHDDIFVLKLAPNGTVLTARMGGSSSDDYLTDMAINSDGVFIGGFFGGSKIDLGSDHIEVTQNYSMGYLIKLTHDDQLLWVRTLNDSIGSKVSSIALTDSGEAIVTGWWPSGHIFLSKVSPNGKILFSHGFTHYDPDGRWSVASNGRDYFLTASLSSATPGFGRLGYPSAGYRDAAVVKFNEVGYPQWLTQGKGDFVDYGRKIAAKGNSIYAGGFFESGKLFLGDLTLTKFEQQGGDMFLAKLTDNTPNQCPNVNDFKLKSASNFCQGDSVQLIIDNPYAAYTRWFRNGIDIGHTNDKNIYIDKDGLYEVYINENTRCIGPKLEVKVDYLSNKTSLTDVAINPLPEFEISAPLTTCRGDTLRLSVSENSKYSYSWSIPDGITHSDLLQSSISIFVQTSMDTIMAGFEVKNKETGCLKKNSISIVVKPLPNLLLTKTEYLLSVSTNNAKMFNWFLSNQELLEEKNKTSITIKKVGSYHVLGTDDFGCSNVSNSVTVDFVLGDIVEMSGVIFPNPANDFLYISSRQPFEKVEICDINGHVVKYQTEKDILDLRDLSAGTYVLKLYLDRKIQIIRFIKT